MNTEASPQVIPVDQVVADHLSENTMRITRFFPDTFKPRGVVITRSHPVLWEMASAMMLLSHLAERHHG
ncbi:MAG: hypothetical protein ABIR27_01335 [Dokdonella sp.]